MCFINVKKAPADFVNILKILPKNISCMYLGSGTYLILEKVYE